MLKKYYLLILFLVGVLLPFRLINSSPKDAKTILLQSKEDCRNQDRTQSILCIKKNIEKGVKRLGIAPFMTSLEEIYSGSNADGGGITVCHDIGHAIGQIGAYYSSKLENSLSSCTNLCTSGCYHGVVEGYIAKGEDIVPKLPSLCLTGENSEKFACFHGLGHGIASIAGFDLTEALKLCDSVSEDGRKDCGAGVIMELYEPSSFAHSQLTFPTDIPTFCRSLWEPYISVCEVTAGLHEYARGKNYQKAIDVCQRVLPKNSDGCIASLAQNIYFVNEDNITEILVFCNKFDHKNIRTCLSGTLEAATMSDPISRGGFLICGLLTGDLGDFCYQALGEKIRFYYGEEKRKNLCEENLSGSEEGICKGN